MLWRPGLCPDPAAVASTGMGHWGMCPLEFVNARKCVVCSVERHIEQQIDIERVVDRFHALAQNRRLA